MERPLHLFVDWELNDGSRLRLEGPCTRLLYAEHVKYDEERRRTIRVCRKANLETIGGKKMAYCGVGGFYNTSTSLCQNASNGANGTMALGKSDFKNIVVDGMGTTGAALVDWLDLVVLLIVLGFIIGIFVKLANLFK